MNSNVLVRNYDIDRSGQKWIPGTVSRQTGPLSYRVQTPSHGTVRRHADQIRETACEVDDFDLDVCNVPHSLVDDHVGINLRDSILPPNKGGGNIEIETDMSQTSSGQGRGGRHQHTALGTEQQVLARPLSGFGTSNPDNASTNVGLEEVEVSAASTLNQDDAATSSVRRSKRQRKAPVQFDPSDYD